MSGSSGIQRCCECGCGEPVSRRFAPGHHLKLRAKRPAGDRFWEKVDKTDTCWNWTGAKNDTGYGTFWLSGRYVKAHRFAFEALVGAIPEGRVLDHLCSTPACVNPAHLEPVSQGENVRRGRVVTHKRTHCRRGHEYTPENILIRPDDGYRRCLACINERRAVAS